MVAAVVLLLAQVAGPAPAGSLPAPGNTPTVSSAAASISGTVRDTTGSVVPGATITVRDGAKEEQTVSGADGRFTLAASPRSELVLIVKAAGFTELHHTVAPGSSTANIDLVLSPASVEEAVTVTATRG